MRTRDFEMDFFGKKTFGKEATEKFREEWNKMTDEEKLRFMDKRMVSMVNPEDRFSIEVIDARNEECMKMTPEEKKIMVKNREEAFCYWMEHMACVAGRL